MGGQTGTKFNDTRMKMPSGSPLLCELIKEEGRGGGGGRKRGKMLLLSPLDSQNLPEVQVSAFGEDSLATH